MFKRWSFVLLLVLITACSPKTSTPSPTATATPFLPVVPTATITASPTPPTSTPTLTPTVIPSSTVTPPPPIVGPDNFATNVDPLTGLPVSDPKLLDRRPVAVKVNIVPRSTNRPPWGLSFADIVYDYYHNDGYTRLFSIFYGKDAELVGPIRSGRLLDNELVRMYQAIFAYGSADQRINNRLFNSEYSNRLILEGQAVACPPKPATPLCRWEPSGVDLLLGSTQDLSLYITNRGVSNGRQNLNGMTFGTVAPQGGNAGNQVYNRYSGDNYSRWDYDPASGLYKRFDDNVYDQGQGEQYAPLTDRLNNQQITAANVVVLIVPHEYFVPPPGEIVEILLSGSGKAYAFRDGQVYEVTWNRPTTNSVLYLTFPDGTRYPYKPGNTWYQVVSDHTVIKQPDSGVWRFEFRIP